MSNKRLSGRPEVAPTLAQHKGERGAPGYQKCFYPG